MLLLNRFNKRLNSIILLLNGFDCIYFRLVFLIIFFLSVWWQVLKFHSKFPLPSVCSELQWSGYSILFYCWWCSDLYLKLKSKMKSMCTSNIKTCTCFLLSVYTHLSDWYCKVSNIIYSTYTNCTLTVPWAQEAQPSNDRKQPSPWRQCYELMSCRSNASTRICTRSDAMYGRGGNLEISEAKREIEEKKWCANIFHVYAECDLWLLMSTHTHRLSLNNLDHAL